MVDGLKTWICSEWKYTKSITYSGSIHPGLGALSTDPCSHINQSLFPHQPSLLTHQPITAHKP